MMNRKDAWFKPGYGFSFRGPYEAGLWPANWKGWLVTLLAITLIFAAWKLASYFGEHHYKYPTIASWAAIPVIALIYMQIANMTSTRP